MRQLIIFNIAVIACLIFFWDGCSSGTYYANFKNEKKKVDTLVIFHPYVFVESVDHKEYSEEFSVEETLEKKIFEKSKSLLSKKYVLRCDSTFADAAFEKDLKSHLNTYFLDK